jgi:hypothetical protein
MSTTSIGDCRAVPYEQYERARRLLVDALFVGAFDKTTLGRKIRRFLDQENSSGEAASRREQQAILETYMHALGMD